MGDERLKEKGDTENLRNLQVGSFKDKNGYEYPVSLLPTSLYKEIVKDTAPSETGRLTTCTRAKKKI
jgi:hypothetical protein